MITTAEAAKIKGCTIQAVLDAIAEGKINAGRFGKAWAIREDKKLEAWQPMAVRQEAGRASGTSRKKKREGDKS